MSTFSGMRYPIFKTPQGYFPVADDIDLLKGDLLILLLTNPGERVMIPQYGTPLNTLMFDPNDSTLANRARAMISNSISTWEPRVIVDAINVSNGITSGSKGFLNPSDDLSQSNSVLAIQILFRYPGNIQSVQELVLQVPIQGGNNANSA